MLHAWVVRVSGEGHFHEETLHGFPHLPQSGGATSKNKCLICPTEQDIFELKLIFAFGKRDQLVYMVTETTGIHEEGLACYLKVVMKVIFT